MRSPDWCSGNVPSIAQRVATRPDLLCVSRDAIRLPVPSATLAALLPAERKVAGIGRLPAVASKALPLSLPVATTLVRSSVVEGILPYES
jgi:hypothetical protein